MIDVKALRSNREKEFNENFDFMKFDEFINKVFSNNNNQSVMIGLEPDVHFKGYGLVSFIPGNSNGYWHTGCQIPYRILQYVRKYLEANGFKTTVKGIAGFDEYDVLIAKL